MHIWSHVIEWTPAATIRGKVTGSLGRIRQFPTAEHTSWRTRSASCRSHIGPMKDCEHLWFSRVSSNTTRYCFWRISRWDWRRFKLILASICQVKFHWNAAFPTPHCILTGGGYLPSDRCDYKYCTKPCDKNLTLDVLVRHPQVVKRFPLVYFPIQNQSLGPMLQLSSHSNSIWEEQQQLSIRPGP